MKRFIVLALTLCAVLSCATPSAPLESGLEPTVADALAALEAAPLPPLAPDTDVWHRRPPSGFVPASPDTRSQKDIDAAVCWGFEDGRQNTNRNWMSSQSGNSDPVYDFPTVENGALVQHVPVLPTAASSVCGAGSVLANVTNLNRGVNLQLAQSDTTACTLSAGQLIVNATHPSSAWTYVVNAGNVWKLSVPMNAVGPTTPAGTSPVAWSNGDSVTVYSLPQVDLVYLDAVFADWNGGFTNFPTLNEIHVLDPSGPGNDGVNLGARTFVMNSQFDREAVFGSTSTDTSVFAMNNYFAGGGISAGGNVNPFAPGISIFGGVISSQFVTNPVSTMTGHVLLAADTIVTGAMVLNSPDVSAVNAFFPSGIGTVYLETGATLYVGGVGQFFSPTNITGGSNVPKVYGGGALKFIGNARWSYPTGAGAAAATFTQTGGFAMNLAGTKMAILNLANAAPWTGNITVSAANLDANLGATSGCGVGLGVWLCNQGNTY